jgi:GMP synthase-like glutamine amidotransferase
MTEHKIKVAVIDLYNNKPNKEIGCIKEAISEAGLNFKIFETRYKNDIPDIEYDIFISSGGPGDPFDGEGTSWEKNYFNLLDRINSFNNNSKDEKKYLFFICHSFQLMARYYNFAEVNKAPSKSYGLIPFAITEDGKDDPLFKDLHNPFYATDLREYQVVNPDKKKFEELNAKIISIAHENNDKDRVLAAVRISDEIVGTQFHPEIDPESMIYYLNQEYRKKHIIEKYGEKRYSEMLDLAMQPDKLLLTRKTVLPNFLKSAIEKLSLF